MATINNSAKSCCNVSRNQLSLNIETKMIELTKTSADTSKMVRILGGEFLLGSEDEEILLEDGEFPRRKVQVSPFYMNPYTVTNEQFIEFIKGTGYETDAEKYGWSFVFHLLVDKKNEKDIIGVPEQTPWWIAVKGASW